MSFQKKNNILLQVCCIGCGAYAIEVLKKEYNKVCLYFYNPNIWPQEEYFRRLEDAQRVSREYDLEIIYEKYDHDQWLKKVQGLENEPEKGKRCLLCYEDRLLQTAQKAREIGYEFFSTTLTISPHKSAEVLCYIGRSVGEKIGVQFLDIDFKKNDGFKKSCELSRKLNLYRQNYCGCEFSKR